MKPSTKQIQSKIEQILIRAKTFRIHSLILHDSIPVSPYDLASNGFVNKLFNKEEQVKIPLNQTVCICHVTECSKIIKFNNLLLNTLEDSLLESLQQHLNDHELNCEFHKRKICKLDFSQLFQVAHLIFDNIVGSYKYDENRISEKLKLDWTKIQYLFIVKNDLNGVNSIIYECYKFLDNRFNVMTKNYSRKLMLSLFGWRYSSVNQQNTKITLKCHYCGVKIQKGLNENINFEEQHNNWCLIRNPQYKMWKLIIKKKYLENSRLDRNELIQEQVEKQQMKKYSVPRSMKSLEAKDIQYEIYSLIKPFLMKIDQIRLTSDQHTHKITSQNKQQDYNTSDYYFQSQNLHKISSKCQEIIKDFINSIKFD